MRGLHRIILIVLFLVPLASPVSADWTRQQVALELSYQVLHFVDWQQTRYIARHPDEYREINPILGDHPDTEWVDAYFLATGIGHFLVSHALPDRYREYWQYVTVGIVGAVVGWNYSIGIRMEF
jgi:hypothetical protein